MKYWGLLAAKLLAGVVFLYGVWVLMEYTYSVPVDYLDAQKHTKSTPGKRRGYDLDTLVLRRDLRSITRKVATPVIQTEEPPGAAPGSSISPAEKSDGSLAYVSLMFGYNLLVQGVLFLIIWDQRYRCRQCGRRLRMPVGHGSHGHVLFGPPRTDYICIYGHGTLKVPESNISGQVAPEWKQNQDMWKELASLPAHSEEDDE